MNAPFRLALVFLITTVGLSARAQHCAPIVESYLSEISVQRDRDATRFRLEYRKSGGRRQPAYQVYVVAFLERDGAKVPAPPPGPVLDKEAALVVHTQVVRRGKDGGYALEFTLNDDALAKRLIEHFRLTEKDRAENGGWGAYNDRVRVAVFVPFLEDRTYSNLDGLPEERHECNYHRDRALLFQVLPHRFSLHFGVVKDVRLEPGKHRVEINGDKPARDPKDG